MPKNVLLLTATIRPKSGQTQLAIVDEVQRFEEYRAALAHYSDSLRQGVIDYVVFAENSDFELTDLKNQFTDPRIEWLSCYGLDYDASFHRGYGEFKLIDHAYSVSRVLASCEETDVVWKISGRYILKNIGVVVRRAPIGFDLYCQTSACWAEMSVMAWSNSGYKRYLRSLWPEFATGMAPELILASSINQWRLNDSKVVVRFAWPCHLVGLRGSSGTSYEGRFGYLSYLFRLLVHWAR